MTAAPELDPDPIRHARSAARQASSCASPDAAAEVLEPLFADVAWLEALVRAWTVRMAADPLAMPTLSATRGGSGASLILAQAPGVTLLVTRIAGAAERFDLPTSPPSVRFSGQLCLMRLLGNQPVAARLALLPAGRERCRSRSIRLKPGKSLRLDERRRALWIAPPDEALFVLRARIDRRPVPPVRRHDLRSGRLTELVQGDERFARAAMLLSCLRAQSHGAAVPVAIDLLNQTKGRERWTVMRELLALDAQAAWPHLEAMAAFDPEPAVRAAAGMTIARFAHRREDAPCPA